MCSRLMMVSGVLFLIFYFHQSVYQHILSPSVSFLCLSTRFLSTLCENVCFIYYSLLLFKLTVLFPTFKCKFPAGSASGKGDMMDSSLFLILSTVPKVGLLESVYVCKHMLVCVHAYMYVATQEGEYCINNNNNALSCVLLCIAGEEFPGLFTWSVPVHTWLSDSIHLVLNTFWGSRSEVVVVNTQTRSVVRVRPGQLNVFSYKIKLCCIL